MALSDTAALVSSLELKDKFTPTVNKFEKSLAGLERTSNNFGKTLGKVGSHAAQGLGNAVRNIEPSSRADSRSAVPRRPSSGPATSRPSSIPSTPSPA